MRLDKERAEKEKHWTQIESKIDRIGDRLGLGIDPGIDPGIKETIVVLLALGFETSASCQGHLGHGRLAPWVDIGERIPTRPSENVSIKEKILLRMKKFLRIVSILLLDKFYKGLAIDLLFVPRETKKKTRGLRKRNLKEQMRLMELLDEFNKDKEISSDVRLILAPMGRGGACLISRGARFQPIRSRKEQKEKLEQYQQEMTAFTDFLKKKYFKTKAFSSARPK